MCPSQQIYSEVPAPADLPQAPREKSGWPWSPSEVQSLEVEPESRKWPRISIVTPSRNQGKYLEETIRSVLLQGYPNLEYIVIDGGSTDDSVGTIKRYEPWLAHWESRPDRGQAHAINDGFALSTGSILGWINSDDALYPGTLSTFQEKVWGMY